MATTEVTDSTFSTEVLESDKPVLVDFWAAWCGPCRQISPIVDEIGQENADKLKVVKLNVDDYPQLAAQYQITSIPALKVFKSGEVVKSIIGAKPKRALEKDLSDFIG